MLTLAFPSSWAGFPPFHVLFSLNAQMGRAVFRLEHRGVPRVFEKGAPIINSSSSKIMHTLSVRHCRAQTVTSRYFATKTPSRRTPCETALEIRWQTGHWEKAHEEVLKLQGRFARIHFHAWRSLSLALEQVVRVDRVSERLGETFETSLQSLILDRQTVLY